MVEIVTTGNGCLFLDEPGVDVARINHSRLTGQGFVGVSILGIEISANGDGIIIATDEFAIKTGLQPTLSKVSGVELAKEDKVYHLPSVSLDDGNTRLTLMEDL